MCYENAIAIYIVGAWAAEHAGGPEQQSGQGQGGEPSAPIRKSGQLKAKEDSLAVSWGMQSVERNL